MTILVSYILRGDIIKLFVFWIASLKESGRQQNCIDLKMEKVPPQSHTVNTSLPDKNKYKVFQAFIEQE